MKILYCFQYFKPPSVSGSSRAYEIAKEMIARGHEVTMLCSYNQAFERFNKKGSKYTGNIDGINIIAYNIPYSNKMGIFKRCMAFTSFAFKSAIAIITNKYDMLYATSTPLSIASSCIISRLFKPFKKVVFEIRDPWPDVPIAMGIKNPFLIIAMKMLEWCGYNLSNGCIGLSTGMVDIIKTRSFNKNKKVIHAPNMANTSTFIPTNCRDKGLDGFDNSKIVGLFAGAHGLVNNLDFLLDVALVLKKKKRTDISILLVGDGREKEKLQKRAEIENIDNVYFYPPIPKEKLAILTPRCDIGLMVNRDIPIFHYGNSPNKYFEFLASGIPVLTNMKGFIADDIKQYNCGLYSEPNDAEEYANNFIKLADNELLRKQMGERSRKLAELKYSRDKITKEILDFIEVL